MTKLKERKILSLFSHAQNTNGFEHVPVLFAQNALRYSVLNPKVLLRYPSYGPVEIPDMDFSYELKNHMLFKIGLYSPINLKLNFCLMVRFSRN